jgi:eukaryotic-like serine/threonine-protein kinase
MDHSSSPVPKILFGYDVIEHIGDGAASHIYAVSDHDTRQIYALKHVVANVEKEQRFIDQLINEYEVSQQVDHPRLRKCVDMKVNRTMLRRIREAALIMELFDGLPLDQRKQDRVSDLIDYFIQTAEGLAALHAKQLVHCDLKPSNILVNVSGDVKVIDLGQACPIGTVKKRIQGTPDYIAPEQVKCEPVSCQTDIYNFGATMYWAMTRKNMPTLFTLKKGANSFLLGDGIKTPRELNSEVPETLSNLIMECVRTAPSKRPADMLDVARRLATIRHGAFRNTAASDASDNLKAKNSSTAIPKKGTFPNSSSAMQISPPIPNHVTEEPTRLNDGLLETPKSTDDGDSIDIPLDLRSEEPEAPKLPRRTISRGLDDSDILSASHFPRQ